MPPGCPSQSGLEVDYRIDAGCPILTSRILRRWGGDFDFQYAHVAADAFVRPAKRAAPDECFRSYVISIQFEIVNLAASKKERPSRFLSRDGCPTLLASYARGWGF